MHLGDVRYLPPPPLSPLEGGWGGGAVAQRRTTGRWWRDFEVAQMRVTFPTPPAIGFAISIDGQRFDLVALEPHQRRDGAATTLLVWRSECPTCGAGFAGKSPSNSTPQTRRCEQHRAPGKKVR